MPLALSTSWNAFRYERAKDLLFEIKEIGFSTLELGFNLSRKMVDDFQKLVKDKQIEVISVHNFCPIPKGLSRKEALPDYYSMSSTDERERNLAVKFAKVSIETAAKLGAKAVVLHCGRVEIPDRTRDLISFYNAGFKDTPKFSALRQDIIEERNTLAKPYLENTFRSLEELNKSAQGQGIQLGVETRFYFREIPVIEEIGIILNTFKGSNIFYWHDTGHALVMEKIGLVKAHTDFLNQYGDSLLGIHLHNIVGCKDHQAPVNGELDFSCFKPFLNKNTIKVVEAHYPASHQEIKESKLLLEGLFHE